jgi:hypothetical protein
MTSCSLLRRVEVSSYKVRKAVTGDIGLGTGRRNAPGTGKDILILGSIRKKAGERWGIRGPDESFYVVVERARSKTVSTVVVVD